MACHYYNCDSQGVIDQQRRSAKYIQPLILGIDSALCFLCFYFRSLTVQSVKCTAVVICAIHLVLVFHCIYICVCFIAYLHLYLQLCIVHLSVVYVLRTSEQRKALLLASALRSQTAKPELFFVHISIWFEICICICNCICI